MRPGMRVGIRVSIRVDIRVVMVQKFGARCYSVRYSNCYSELLQYPHAAVYAPVWLPA